MTNNWFPVIDLEKCTGCLTCVDFCPHGVFDVDGAKPIVVRPEECVEFCRGCQKVCDQGAIRFPGDPEP